MSKGDAIPWQIQQSREKVWADRFNNLKRKFKFNRNFGCCYGCMIITRRLCHIMWSRKWLNVQACDGVTLWWYGLKILVGDTFSKAVVGNSCWLTTVPKQMLSNNCQTDLKPSSFILSPYKKNPKQTIAQLDLLDLDQTERSCEKLRNFDNSEFLAGSSSPQGLWSQLLPNMGLLL